MNRVRAGLQADINFTRLLVVPARSALREIPRFENSRNVEMTILRFSVWRRSQESAGQAPDVAALTLARGPVLSTSSQSHRQPLRRGAGARRGSRNLSEV